VAEKIGRIAVRVGLVEKAHLMKAAQQQGVSLTDFVLSASRWMAEAVLCQPDRPQGGSTRAVRCSPRMDAGSLVATPRRESATDL